MTTESTPASEPRSLALLWPSPGSSAVRRGRRQRLDVADIASAGVRVADAGGLAAVSMRRIAAEVGVPAMTLYGYLPGKAELVDLMCDAVLGELYPDGTTPTEGTWRSRIEAVVRANREFHLRHPWVLAAGRFAPGPNLMRKYEIELRAVDGLGLSEVQMDLLFALLDGFVRGTLGGTGDTPAAGAHAARVLDPDRFPTASRVARAASDARLGGREQSFEFGLERLLDGVGVLILNPSR